MFSLHVCFVAGGAVGVDGFFGEVVCAAAGWRMILSTWSEICGEGLDKNGWLTNDEDTPAIPVTRELEPGD